MAPLKYPSLYAGDEDGKVTTSAAMWGLPVIRTSKSP
ncbi:Conserved membrane protein of uncharacterised function [Mycobacterium tuberculosis]|nr:Conserved membrane protein of uncharacterised function [Mycobacterium tuberculosis]